MGDDAARPTDERLRTGLVTSAALPRALAALIVLALSALPVIVAGPANGTLIGGLNADGSFTYSPNHDFKGDDTFTYQASNSNGLSNVATVKIKVRK